MQWRHVVRRGARLNRESDPGHRYRAVGHDLEEGAVVLGILKVVDHDGRITKTTANDIS